VIFSNRAEPPALSLAARRSRRRRACFWTEDSPESILGGWVSGLDMVAE